MRGKTLFLAGTVLAFAFHLGLAAEKRQTTAMIKEAQAKARTNDVAAAREAYAKVFAAPDLTIAERVAAHLDIARVLQHAKTPSLSEAVKECEKALAIPNLPGAERFKILNVIAKAQFDSNFRGAMPSYQDDGIRAAAATYEQIVSDPAADNGVKIAALEGLANCHFERMDVEGATAALRRAVAISGLLPEEKNAALFNLAKGYQRQLEPAKARKVYEEIVAAKPDPRLQAQVESRIADLIAETGKSEDAADYLRRCNRTDLDVATFYKTHGETESAMAVYRKILGDPKTDEKTRWTALGNLMQMTMKGCPELREVMKQYDAYASGFKDRVAERYILQYFVNWSANPSTQHNHEFVAWVLKKLLANPNLSEKDALNHNRRLFDALLGHGKTGEAKKVGETILALPGVTPPVRMQQQLALAVLAGADKPEALQKAAQTILASFKSEDVSAAERAEAVQYAAKVAMKMQRYESAGALDAIREKMLATEPRRSLTCEFAENAPRDISGFLASPLFNNPKNRGKLDRKYGDNLQFLLETDSATVGRKVNVRDEGAGAGPTEFCVACDADGFSIFILAPSARLDDIAGGLAAMGGYEMYLAPGEHQAYYCLGVDLPGGKTSDSFITMYNNQYFRQALLKEGTVKSESRITPKGVATLIFFPWELFYDKLPANGDKWQYDNIHWERGGYSWGGSKSVHNRSSFGDLVFANMTKENLNQIKRRIVGKALARYRNEMWSDKNGLISYWQDSELGDREFYKSELQPLVERLNEYGKRVNKEMTAQDVETLFSQAVPDWMEFRYKVAKLRKDYLDAKRVGGQ